MATKKEIIHDDETGEAVETPSAVEQLADAFEGKVGPGTYLSAALPVSTRLSPITVANLEAIGAELNKSRNWTIQTMLDIGLEEFLSKLSPKTKRRFIKARNDRAAQLAEQVRESVEE
jgi:hypothetical protein